MDRIEGLGGIEEMIECQPEASGMMEKQQRKNHRKRHPHRELLLNRRRGERIEQKKPGHGDGDGGGVIDVNRADEITLFPLEFELAMGAMLEHSEWFRVELADAATRTA